MSHARIEELSDSDSDPPEDDLEDFADSDIIRTVNQNQNQQPSAFNQWGKLSSQTAPHAPAVLAPQQPQPTSPFTAQEFLRPQGPQQQPGAGFNTTTQPPPEYKSYQCLYPIYFDANKTRQQGRRVGIESAVANPLAREIVDAVQSLGLRTVFEPGKMHPKDWSNPGRVRVGLKDAGGRSRVKNSKVAPGLQNYNLPFLICVLMDGYHVSMLGLEANASRKQNIISTPLSPPISRRTLPQRPLLSAFASKACPCLMVLRLPRQCPKAGRLTKSCRFIRPH